MRSLRKLSSLYALSLFVLTLIVGLYVFSGKVFADDTSGECGDNATWSYKDGTITISGTGRMWDHDSEHYGIYVVPWYDYLLNDTETVVIEDGITYVGADTFNVGNDGNEVLKNIVIGNDVEEIGYGAFDHNIKLKNVTISGDLKKIGSNAFYYCKSLKKLPVPESVTEIGDSAFGFCESITSIKLHEGLKTIGDFAFSECSSCTEVRIPKSVTKIGDNAFDMQTSLSSITVKSGNTKYSDNDGVLFDKKQTTLICYPAGKSGKYTVPSTVKTIKEYAFYENGNITSVKIPDSVTKIEKYAFGVNPSLKSVYIGKGANLPEDAFRLCRKLEKVSLAEGIKKIGKHAFIDCKKLKAVTIPGSVTEIGKGAFGFMADNDGDDTRYVPVPGFTISAPAKSAGAAYAKENDMAYKKIKANQLLKASAGTKSVKYKALKKKAQSVAPIKVNNSKGKVTYKKVSGSSKLSVNKKTGKVTIKAKTKKGTYKMKVQITASGNKDYKKGTADVTVKIIVK